MAVYFLASFVEGRIKIGYSADPDRRIKTILQAQPNPDKLRLLWVNFLADREHEKVLHHHLDEYRLSGEWFKAEALYGDKCCDRLAIPFRFVIMEERDGQDDPYWRDIELQVSYKCEHCKNYWGINGTLAAGPKFLTWTLGIPIDVEDLERDFCKPYVWSDR